MKFMKKAAAAIMAAAIMAALAGCGGTSASSTAVSSKAADSSTSAGAAVEKIKASGTLKVGVKADIPKYSLLNTTTNEYEGFEDDLAKVISGKIFDGDTSKVEFTTVNAKTRGPLLDKGDIDMVIATFTITDDRKQQYDFSDPYMTDAVGFLVKKDSGIKSLKDMNGKTIGVAQSATSRSALEDQAKQQGITLKFSEFATYPEIKAALDSGRIDVFSVDKSILNGYIDDKTEILDDTYAPQDYGVATKKGNDDLAKLVNDTITDLKSSGELQKMLDKWEIK